MGVRFFLCCFFLCFFFWTYLLPASVFSPPFVPAFPERRIEVVKSIPDGGNLGAFLFQDSLPFPLAFKPAPLPFLGAPFGPF